MAMLCVAITMMMRALIGWVVRGMMMKPAAEDTIAEVVFNARQEEMVLLDKPCYAIFWGFKGSSIVRTWYECAEVCGGMDPKECQYRCC